MLSRILFLFIFVCQVAFGLEYLVLDKEYFYKNNAVYAKDLFKGLKSDFFLFEIPASANSYQIKASRIIKIFENEGYSIGAQEPIMTFKKSFSGDNESIKKHILGEFLRVYKQNKIQISGIYLEQITPINFTQEQIREINFYEKLLKRDEGSFYITISENHNEKEAQKIRERKIYFKYKIDAKIQAIITTESISGRKSVDFSNARAIMIPFSKVSSPLMLESELGAVAVRSYTPKDVIITHDRLILKRVVKKGDRILVLLKESGVSLEFVLIAQKDAAVGDVIEAKELNSKKIHKVEILSEGRGKLL
ncbi:MAG: flagellar basal body P-ring formation chaperone FlgA [Helicobacter sp.]|nr:flagellar basal body P-ring formation chaperone FlgA [Helicobacter sp.]